METTLPPPKIFSLSRLGGTAFALGNLLFLANKFDEMSRLFLGRQMADVISGEDRLLIAFGQGLLLLGYVGFLKTYAPPGQFARITFRLFGGGGMVVALGHTSFMDGMPEALFFVVMFGMLLMVPGLILFGISNLRKPVITRWKWLPLFTGLMGFIGFFLFSGETITATFLVFRTLFALGLVGMGVVLGLEKP
ncbi:MAG TPA: hypothetical protein PK530_15135 [Anaerolineales bacterium]|nr:hypothetical protein [Anaerolineales bacterium]